MFYSTLVCFILIIFSILYLLIVFIKPSFLPKAGRTLVFRVSSFIFVLIPVSVLLVNLDDESSRETLILSQKVSEINEAKEVEEENNKGNEVEAKVEPRKNEVERIHDNIAYINVSVATLWTEPDTSRSIDEPSIGSFVDMWEWTKSMSLAQKKWLVGNLQTQALYGQTVTILEEQDDWVKVAVHGQPTPKSDLGYVAWMPKIQLAEENDFFGIKEQHPFALVTDPTTWLYTDEKQQDKFKEISFNTRLPVISQKGDVTLVVTPSDGEKWISSEGISVYKSEQEIPVPTGDDLVLTGEQFLGLPYLWAGTSGFGFDCSGFTHSIYKANGITIPRDSSVQASNGIAIEKKDLKKGDLLFFAYEKGKGSVHHVGMYIGDGKMIHSPNTESTVEIINVFESEYYSSEYAGARRYIEN